MFHHGGVEAIVGLAYPAMAEEGHTPLFDIIMKQHIFERNMFAVYLPHVKHGSNTKPEITMGFYDEEKFTGDIDWHPVVEKESGFFALKLDDIKVDGKPLNICSYVEDPNMCIIAPDTGMPKNTLPSKLIKKF